MRCDASSISFVYAVQLLVTDFREEEKRRYFLPLVCAVDVSMSVYLNCHSNRLINSESDSDFYCRMKKKEYSHNIGNGWKRIRSI